MIAGLRGVGTDYTLYVDNYDDIVKGTFEYVDYSSILIIVIRLLGKLGVDFQVIVCAVSFATIWIAFTILKKCEKEINFSVAIFSYMVMFYQMSFNLFRQILAAEVFMMASIYLFRDHNKARFGICYVIGSLIHSSIIPFGVIYFIRETLVEEKGKRARKAMYLVVLIVIALLPFGADILGRLSSIFSHYAWFLTRFSYNEIGFGLLRYVVSGAIPAAYYMKITSKAGKESIKNRFLGFYTIMGTILWLSSYVSSASLYRIAYNLLIVLPLLHGVVFKKINRKESILIWITVILIMMVFWYFDLKITNSGETIPYMFYWERN